MFCSNCGQTIDSRERFCSKCGVPAEKSVNVKKSFSPMATLLIILGVVVLIVVVVLTVVFLGKDTQKTIKIKGNSAAQEEIVKVENSSVTENSFKMKIITKPAEINPINISDTLLDETQLIIMDRLNKLGIFNSQVTRDIYNNIIIMLPGLENPQRVIDFITMTGLLEFKILESMNADKKPVFGPVLMTGDKLVKSQAGYNSNGNVIVSMSFTAEGQKEFEKITSENVGKQLAIVLDGEMKSAPRIQSAISGDAVIENIGTFEEAKDIALVLQSGALPVDLLIQEVTLVSN